ncbi:MAG TPA: hypothetical protein VMU95_32710 [Trebonia sp.]|nr:hypothetical protein [Trebonia sp.]
MAWMRYQAGGAALAIALLAGSGSVAAAASARPGPVGSSCREAIGAALRIESRELDSATLLDAKAVSRLNDRVLSHLRDSKAACAGEHMRVTDALHSARLSFELVPGALAGDWRIVKADVEMGIAYTEIAHRSAF